MLVSIHQGPQNPFFLQAKTGTSMKSNSVFDLVSMAASKPIVQLTMKEIDKRWSKGFYYWCVEKYSLSLCFKESRILLLIGEDKDTFEDALDVEIQVAASSIVNAIEG